LKLVWSRDAHRDLYAILEYYQQLEIGVAARIAEAIKAEPRRLLDYPQMGTPTRRRGTRKWPVRGTPFRLYYSIEGDILVVQRVVHSAMDEA
jgi:addiction module RelE/StbE family toxin